MKTSVFTRLLALLLAVTIGIGVFSSCGGNNESEFGINITNGDEVEVVLGGTLLLETEDTDGNSVKPKWSASNDCITVSINGNITALKAGEAIVTATYKGATDKVLVKVVENRTLTLGVDNVYLINGNSATLSATVSPAGGMRGEIAYHIEGNDQADPYVSLSGNKLTYLRAGGEIKITAYIIGTDVRSNTITVYTVDKEPSAPNSITISLSDTSLSIGDSATLSFVTDPVDASQDITYEIATGKDVISIYGNTVTAIGAGTASIVASIGGTVSNTISVSVDSTLTDPYENVNKTDFYASYTPAKSYTDATFRTQHGLMSGNIIVPDQAPTIAQNRPTEGGSFVLNTDMIYIDGGKTYVVVDSTGNEVVRIYYGGAYITLEEVAAYLYAFGDIPPNYSSGKKPSSTMWSTWGEYLRANHSNFSGSTSSYPYEPELPNISGCGGKLQYKEVDIGTTGTTAGEGYAVKIYNDGSKITRGAARIVYGRNDLNHNGVFDVGEIYLFYTYNHYNDFQEYLNYYGGWGEMFGNVTGGGTLSSKNDYNPTPYVPVARQSFTASATVVACEYVIVTYLGSYTKQYI